MQTRWYFQAGASIGSKLIQLVNVLSHMIIMLLYTSIYVSGCTATLVPSTTSRMDVQCIFTSVSPSFASLLASKHVWSNTSIQCIMSYTEAVLGKRVAPLFLEYFLFIFEAVIFESIFLIVLSLLVVVVLCPCGHFASIWKHFTCLCCLLFMDLCPRSQVL